jgi:hypothetical protein
MHVGIYVCVYVYREERMERDGSKTLCRVSGEVKHVEGLGEKKLPRKI